MCVVLCKFCYQEDRTTLKATIPKLNKDAISNVKKHIKKCHYAEIKVQSTTQHHMAMQSNKKQRTYEEMPLCRNQSAKYHPISQENAIKQEAKNVGLFILYQRRESCLGSFPFHLFCLGDDVQHEIDLSRVNK